MKFTQFFALVFITSFLMGCQIEVAPISDEQVNGQEGTTESNTTDNRQDSNGDSSQNGADRSVTLYWSAPIERVNGEVMVQADIGGYEIRFKKINDSNYESVLINDASVEQYSFNDLDNLDDYVFEVAVFDTDGIYSDFVVAQES